MFNIVSQRTFLHEWKLKTNDLPQKTEEHESNYSFTFPVTA
jgi:hypothetical protein